MAFSISPSVIHTAILYAVISTNMTWLRFLNKKVPEPYLDEVFHIPQAQAYWAGQWTHWDGKITTPPGLYLWSYVFNTVRRITALDPGAMITVSELRFSNSALVYVLIITLLAWNSVTRRPANNEAKLHKELTILQFPLLAFFSGLYYTDLFSAWTVVATFVAWEAGRRSSGLTQVVYQTCHLCLGLLSLGTRQTNIFWVAVFLGGLQLVDTVQAGATVEVLQDPEVGEAVFEDIFHLIFQLLSAAITQLPSLILALWPQLTLLASFAGFVIWNGGVVLGDKSNHIATIHTPQLLYIWPCIVFFSWPVLLPQIANPRRLISRLPRAWLSVLIMLAMAAAVHYNTIIHPFTLADNRHYVFYVFRILMRKWWIKYAAVPIYFICACLVIGALNSPRKSLYGEETKVRLSFVLVWFASTALSLISAPLVEPRYFIVPWLVWRMYVPDMAEGAEEQQRTETQKATARANTSSSLTKLQQVLITISNYSLWIELLWYVAINFVTCKMFLENGFTWPQEPGKIQRFMW